MWVRFTARFDWDPPEFGGRVTWSREAWTVESVRHDHGEAAIAAGKAVKVRTPRRGETPVADADSA